MNVHLADCHSEYEPQAAVAHQELFHVWQLLGPMRASKTLRSQVEMAEAAVTSAIDNNEKPETIQWLRANLSRQRQIEIGYLGVHGAISGLDASDQKL